MHVYKKHFKMTVMLNVMMVVCASTTENTSIIAAGAQVLICPLVIHSGIAGVSRRHVVICTRVFHFYVLNHFDIGLLHCIHAAACEANPSQHFWHFHCMGCGCLCHTGPPCVRA